MNKKNKSFDVLKPCFTISFLALFLNLQDTGDIGKTIVDIVWIFVPSIQTIHFAFGSRGAYRLSTNFPLWESNIFVFVSTLIFFLPSYGWQSISQSERTPLDPVEEHSCLDWRIYSI